MAYEEVVLGIVEDHVDGLVLKNNLFESDNVFVRDLPIQLLDVGKNAMGLGGGY